jgi:hypothetical protein
MKTLIQIMNCLESYIKKNFFNLPKTELSHDCKKVPGMHFLKEDQPVPEEEYATIYKEITRWQTL